MATSVLGSVPVRGNAAARVTSSPSTVGLGEFDELTGSTSLDELLVDDDESSTDDELLDDVLELVSLTLLDDELVLELLDVLSLDELLSVVPAQTWLRLNSPSPVPSLVVV